ncbi:hypothetical protein M8J71_13275 [Pseudarthrobacter sp. R1]|uniref:hypothetical protein n=1 Tax=Pseudarthrobacter sp. R1 TaxID=2944934 RepID=UPI002108659B|nr:hypothetical protein [Pseudarthrobacter sp. R1]MCQ6271450.1 hypothetical protein [Pseudarthrobacter sp. R1]
MNSHTGRSAFDAAGWQPVDDWASVEGRYIEIYRHGVQIDRGVVDAVTADGTILWLMQDGALPRRIIEQLPGTYIRGG